MVSFYLNDPASLPCSLTTNFPQASILTLGGWFLVVEIASNLQTKTRSSTQNAKKKIVATHLLGGGFKDLLCSSGSFGEMIQFHLPIFFRCVAKKHQLVYLVRVMFLLCNKGLVNCCFLVDFSQKLLAPTLPPFDLWPSGCLGCQNPGRTGNQQRKHKSFRIIWTYPKEMFKPCGNQQQKMKDDQLIWPECVFAYINLGTLHEM